MRQARSKLGVTQSAMESACGDHDRQPRLLEWDNIHLAEQASTPIVENHVVQLPAALDPIDDFIIPDKAVGYSYSDLDDGSGQKLIIFYSNKEGTDEVGQKTVWDLAEVAGVVGLTEGSCRAVDKGKFKTLPRTSQFTAWQKGTEELETYSTKRLATLALGKEAVDAAYRSKNPVKLSFSNGTVLLLYLPVAYRETVTIESLSEMTVNKRVYTTGRIPPTWCVPVTATLDDTEASSMSAE